MTSSSYTYENLTNESSFRLFRIEDSSSDPTAPSNETQIHLFEASFENSPVYEAISYVWGQDQVESAILCNGEELAVTTNVKAILHGLRCIKPGGTFWLDSICIDQSSLSEKNIQVPKMRSIYGKASLVWIWLGYGTYETINALMFLSDIANILGKLGKDQYFHMPYLPHLIEPHNRFKDKVRDRRGQYDAVDTNFIVDVLNLPWFHRLWVIQELALAKNAVLICGRLLFPWVWFIEALETLQTHEVSERTVDPTNQSRSNPASYHDDTECYRKIGDLMRTRSHNSSISEILQVTRPKSSSNPADKVYGLYGIFDQLKITKLPPVDYNHEVHAVYTEITAAAIKIEKSLAILYQVCLPPLIAELPSWVPDFSNTAFFRPIKIREYHASGSPSQPVYSFNGTQLSVTGVLVDEIQEVATSTSFAMANFRRGYNARLAIGDSTERSNAVIELVRTLQSWVKLGMKVQSYPNDQQPADAFCRTLLQNSRFHSSVVTDPEIYTLIEKCFQILASNFPTAPPGQTHVFHDEIKNVPEYSGTINYYASLFGCGTDFDAWPDELRIRLILRLGKPMLALIQHDMFLNTYHKTFILTRIGYMGTCPRWARVGDSVALLSGLEAPFIVRKDGQHYRLIGPAYVDGIMDGELWNQEQVRSITFI